MWLESSSDVHPFLAGWSLVTSAKPHNDTIAQVYAPYVPCKDNEVEESYDQLGRGLKAVPWNNILVVTRIQDRLKWLPAMGRNTQPLLLNSEKVLPGDISFESALIKETWWRPCIECIRYTGWKFTSVRVLKATLVCMYYKQKFGFW